MPCVGCVLSVSCVRTLLVSGSFCTDQSTLRSNHEPMNNYRAFPPTVLIAALGVANLALLSLAGDVCGAEQGFARQIEEVQEFCDELRSELQFRQTHMRMTELSTESGSSETSREVFMASFDGHGLSVSDTKVNATNPEYFFSLKRGSDDAAWQIVDLAQRLDESRPSTAINLAQRPVHRFLQLNHVPVDVLLAHPGVKIVQWRELAGDEAGVTRAKAVIADPSATTDDGLRLLFKEFSVDFAPKTSGWIPVESTCVWPDGSSITKRCSAFREFGDYRIPTHFRSIRRDSNNKSWSTINSDYEFQTEIPDEKRFYLSFYGFPEPSFEPRSGIRVWALSIVGLIFFAAFLWVFGHRKTGF